MPSKTPDRQPATLTDLEPPPRQRTKGRRENALSQNGYGDDDDDDDDADDDDDDDDEDDDDDDDFPRSITWKRNTL